MWYDPDHICIFGEIGGEILWWDPEDEDTPEWGGEDTGKNYQDYLILPEELC